MWLQFHTALNHHNPSIQQSVCCCEVIQDLSFIFFLFVWPTGSTGHRDFLLRRICLLFWYNYWTCIWKVWRSFLEVHSMTSWCFMSKKDSVESISAAHTLKRGTTRRSPLYWSCHTCGTEGLVENDWSPANQKGTQCSPLLLVLNCIAAYLGKGGVVHV